MDPAAQNTKPVQDDDMVVKLQKQLDYLKKQKTAEESKNIKQFQKKPEPVDLATDDISAEDILNAFSQSKTKGKLLSNPALNVKLSDDELNSDKEEIFANTLDPTPQLNNEPVLNKQENQANSDDLASIPQTVQDQSDSINTDLPTEFDDLKQTEIQALQTNEINDHQTPNFQLTGSLKKEAQPGGSQIESFKYQEIGAELSKDKELEKWIEEVPDAKAFTLPKPVHDDYGEILVQASQIPKPKIILPLSEQEMKKALHQKVTDSFLWLWEWAKRLIQLQPGRVFYPKSKL